MAPQPEKTSSVLNPFQRSSQPLQVRRGSLLSRPHSVLQKLASISEGNPLAPRNSRGFLFQTLSPEKSNSTSDAPQKQMMKKKRGPVEAVNPAAKRICRENKPAGQTKASQRSIFNFLDHWGHSTLSEWWSSAGREATAWRPELISHAQYFTNQ